MGRGEREGGGGRGGREGGREGGRGGREGGRGGREGGRDGGREGRGGEGMNDEYKNTVNVPEGSQILWITASGSCVFVGAASVRELVLASVHTHTHAQAAAYNTANDR